MYGIIPVSRTNPIKTIMTLKLLHYCHHAAIYCIGETEIDSKENSHRYNMITNFITCVYAKYQYALKIENCLILY